MDVLLENAHLSALAGDALRASPADEPADEQGSIEGLRLYFTPITRPNFSGHQSFRERPRRLAFYRARAARAQPWTGVADASSSCASGGTVPRRQETAAQEPRGRSTNTTSEKPPPRRGESTKPRETADARRCRVTCRTRRRRGAAIGARKREIAPLKWQLGEFLLRMG